MERPRARGLRNCARARAATALARCDAAARFAKLPLVALALFAPVASSFAQGAGEEDVRTKSFAIPDTRSSRALADRAQAHVAAGRWAEAIADLQALLEEHRGDVLGPRKEDSSGRRSQQPIHPGASEEARQRLLALPPEARRLYADRYGGEAAAALESARRSADRRALIEVARRWPLADAARDAWWALGDLELELGNPLAARSAWLRASDAAKAFGAELPSGARRRLELVSETGELALEGRPESSVARERENRRSSGYRLPGPGEAFGVAPSAGAYGWRRQIDARSPFRASEGEHYNLFPIQAGELILVSTSLRLIAIDAWSGEVRWQSDEPPGWAAIDAGQVFNTGQKRPFRRADFEEAIDRDSLMIAPAAAGGIAVAALQIPVTQVTNTEYQRIAITKVIPDRRLFAFDLATGRPLWSHLPPPDWDGERGTFAETMRVAGPPVIAGSRLLVPTYRMQGRIEYHVACYDLFDGELLWSTGVISGQKELNMFGRHELEFSAAPLCISGERVIALTQLGVIAALDLYTGELQWETLYDQIALPRTEGWETPPRPQVWRNAPPLVSGTTVVATPLDSMQMIGVDLESGTLLWSLPHRELTRLGSEFSSRGSPRLSLIGALDSSVLLGGTVVLSCRVPGAARGTAQGVGLGGSRPPSEITMSGPLAVSVPPDALPRPVLGERHVIAPTPSRRIALDPSNLRQEDRQLSSDWGPVQGSGNVLLGEGSLYTLSSKYLCGSFEWELLESRWERELAATPQDERAALRLAECFARHGEVELESARLASAMALFARARGALEPRLAGAGRSPDDRGAKSQLERSLFGVLRLEARTLLEQADSGAALERLQRARSIAPDDSALRDTLLALAELQHARHDTAAWLAVLADLDARCGALEMPAASDALARPSAPGDEPGNELRDGSAAHVSVGLWVRLQRAQEYAQAGAVGSELEELHDILARYDDVELLPTERARTGAEGGTRPTVSARIAELLERGPREAYAPFEQRARELFERARAESDLEALERVSKLYPFSQAAREASQARLEAALASGDAAMVVQLVQRELQASGQPLALAGEREIELLVRLGAVLGARGNADLERALIASLARHHPDLRSPVPAHGGKSLAELAREMPEDAPPEPSAERSTFDATAAVTRTSQGVYALLGEAPLAGRDPLLLCARQEVRKYVLQAFETSNPAEPVWSSEFERSALMPGWSTPPLRMSGRVLVAGRREVTALATADGKRSWSWACEESIEALRGASGVALVTLSDDVRRMRLVALDVASGVELWSRAVPPELSAVPTCGRSKAVLLPASHAGTSAQVLELFTGGLALELPLEAAVGENDQRGAWIEGELLVLPSFPKSSARADEGSRDCVSGWDLESGRRVWRVGEDEERELDSIARVGSDAYLLFLASSGSGRASAGGILELDTRLGAVRPVQNVHLSPDDQPIGVRRSTVVELGGPYLFVLSRASGGREALIRAIHLPFGERWVHRLPVVREQVYNPSMALPALSQSTVALAYSETSRGRSGEGSSTTLVFFDRNSGLKRDSRTLHEALGPADALELAAIGDSLWIGGRDELVVLSRQ